MAPLPTIAGFVSKAPTLKFGLDKQLTDAWEVGRQGSLRSLGVNLQVDLWLISVTRLISSSQWEKNTYIRVEISLQGRARCLQQRDIEVAAHDHQALGQRRKLGVHPDSQSNVGQGATAVDDYLARVLADLLDQPGGGVVARQRGVGEALVEGLLHDLIRVTRRRVVAERLVGQVLSSKGTFLSWVSALCAFSWRQSTCGSIKILTYPWQVAVQILPRLEQLRRVDEGVVGALVHWDTRRQVPDLEGREPVKTRLKSPRVSTLR